MSDDPVGYDFCINKNSFLFMTRILYDIGSDRIFPASTNLQVSDSPQQYTPPTSDNIVIAQEDLTQVDKDLIFEGLKNLYKKKVLPLEVASKYSHFSSPPMGPSDFDAKPMVLILGQYSVGKTSFIRSLLKQDFPGQRIGPGWHTFSRSFIHYYIHIYIHTY